MRQALAGWIAGAVAMGFAADAEREATDRAVRTTAGQVLKYGGRVVDAPYAFANRTEDVALRGVRVKSNALMRLLGVVVGGRVAREDDHRRRVGGRRHDAGHLAARHLARTVLKIRHRYR